MSQLRVFVRKHSMLTQPVSRKRSGVSPSLGIHYQASGIKRRSQSREISNNRKQHKTRDLDGGKRPTTTNADATWSDTILKSAKALVEAQPQQYLVAKQSADPVHGSTRTGDDAFWLSDVPDGGFVADGLTDMMSLDADAILAQDNWVDTSNGEVIGWAQWDGWLGSLDLTRPNMSAGPR